MSATYVDLDFARGWLRPSDLKPAECFHECVDATNDYLRARDRLTNPAVYDDVQLAHALDQMADRPELPMPTPIDVDSMPRD